MDETGFVVCADVETGGLRPTVEHARLLRDALRRPIEAMWTPARPLIACKEDHALLWAMRMAFHEHLPLRLSPDAIWLTLARSFALHVNLHAEALRHHFVKHTGKQQLVVERRDFLLGADNPWHELFPAFSALIGEQTGGASSLLEADFSSNGPLEHAISHLMAMETFQAYFEYVLARGGGIPRPMLSGCGIPRVILSGTEDDWRRLREKASKFADYGLEDWITALDPVLAEFERAKRGEVDIEFWRSMFRYRSGSGPAVMTGWANVLFPYIKDPSGKDFRDRDVPLIPNPFLGDWRLRFDVDTSQNDREPWTDPQGVGIGAFPACSTSVPLTVVFDHPPINMLLVGGLLGVSQRPEDHAVSAECGWIVAYAKPIDPRHDGLTGAPID